MNWRTGTVVGAVLLGVLAAGIGIGRWLAPAVPPSEEAQRKVLYWVAPMDRNYRRDQPGKSPMGMDLVPVYADDAPAGAEDDAGAVRIDPTVAHNLGVRTALAERGSLRQRIEAVGYVEYDEDAVHHVHTRVEGWIESLSVQAAGDPVRAGQTLFGIYSPTLVNAQREYLAALERGDDALRRASGERLLALGMGEAEIEALAESREPSRQVRTLAAADGVVTHLGVRQGIHVTPATHVLSVADLRRVWVLAEVFERHAGAVRPGQPAQVRFDQLPGERWQGTVDYIYPTLDPRTRTLKVRIGFENEGRVLRPNMYARVVLMGPPTEPLVHIPREALIRGGDSDRVALALGDGRFRSVPVQAGIEAGARVAIASGLEAGDEVVVSGQFLIDSESNLASALSRASTADAQTASHQH